MQYVHDVIARFPTVRMWVYSMFVTIAVSGLCLLGGTFWMTDMPAQIALGEGDAAYFSGWHEAEALSAAFDWQVGRWSGLVSTVHIPTTTRAWQVVELVLTNQYIDGSTLLPTIQWRPTAATTVPLQAGEVRRVAVLNDQHPWWRWDSPVTVLSTTSYIGADPRPLGVMILAVEHAPTLVGSGVSAYFGVQLWLMLVILLVGLRLMHVAPAWLWGIIAGMALVYLVVVVPHANGLWPYLHWWSAWLLIQLVLVSCMVLMGWFTAEGIVVAHALPVYVAMQWWALPLLQWMILREGHPIPVRELLDLTPAMIGLWLAWVAGAIGLWWWQRRAPHVWIDRVRTWYFVIVAALVSGWQFVSMVPRFFRYGSGDFQIWVDAARNWVNTGVLYRLENVVANPFALYKRPPFYIMWFTPFVTWTTAHVLDSYRWLNIGLLMLTGLLWMSLVWSRPHRWWWALVIVMSLNAKPVFDTIGLGQTDIVLLFTFTLIYWCSQRRWDWLAGVVIALVASFKIYPIILLVFFGIKQRWSVLWGTLAGFVLWNGIAIAVMGWDVHVLYVTKVFFSIGGTTSWVENQTIAGFIARFYDDIFAMQLLALPAVARAASLLSMALAAVVAVLALRDYDPDDSTYGLQYGLFLMLMVIAIPVAWMHYATILWLVWMLLLLHYLQHPPSVLRAWAFALSMAIIMFGNQRSFNYKYDLGVMTLILSSYKFYALVVLTIVLCVEVLRQRTTWAHAWRVWGAQRLQHWGWQRMATWLAPR